MQGWRPDRLLRAVLIYTMLGLILIWLPLVRGLMDGPTYQWGMGIAGGSGIGGDYWVLILIALFGCSVMFLGWRGARRPFHWLLLAWMAINVVQSSILTAASPDGLRLRGDTLGIDIPLGPALVIMDLTFLALAILWVWRDIRSRAARVAPPWTRRNRRLLTLFVSLLPVQFVLLRFGEPHGTTDQIGVLLTVAQWFLLNAAWYPWQPARAIPSSARRDAS